MESANTGRRRKRRLKFASYALPLVIQSIEDFFLQAFLLGDIAGDGVDLLQT